MQAQQTEHTDGLPFAESTGSAAGEQWEYTTRWHQFQPPDSYLNAMGAEGWELVAFNKASSQVWSSGWVFKRRVQPPNMRGERSQEAR